MRKRTIIIGAGLAGLSCAIELAEKGKEVLLLEQKPFAGGRTASWSERGMAVESGLHRFLGFYRALPQLLSDAGVDVDSIVSWEDAVEIRLPDGGPKAVFGSSPFYKPVRTLTGLLDNNHFITPLEKVRLVKFFAAGFLELMSRPEALDARTVASFAAEQGLSSGLIERVLVPLTAGIFFLPPERYSAYVLFGLLAPLLSLPRPGRGVFRDVLYRTRIGSFKSGMSEVMIEPLVRHVQRRGGEVVTGTAVEKLLLENGRITGVAANGERLHAESVVLAASLASAQRILKQAFAADPWFEPALSLPSMPAATIQFELERPALPADRVTFGPGTCLSSFAEQSRTTFGNAPGRLSVILSPPEKFVAMPEQSLLAHVLTDAKRLGLDLMVRDYRIISHPADFYSLSPETEKLRPSQKTPVRGLFLAGDYTRQRHLATMEGAVVSGLTAARAVLDSDEQG